MASQFNLRPVHRATHASGLWTTVRICLAMALALLMLPFLAFLPPRQEPSLAASAASPSANPARTLSWPADRNATDYVAQLLRQHRLVYVTLPVTPTVILPGSLLGGSYVWRVYAGYGPIDENRRRGPIAQGTFTVGVD